MSEAVFRKSKLQIYKSIRDEIQGLQLSILHRLINKFFLISILYGSRYLNPGQTGHILCFRSYVEKVLMIVLSSFRRFKNISLDVFMFLERCYLRHIYVQSENLVYLYLIIVYNVCIM